MNHTARDAGLKLLRQHALIAGKAIPANSGGIAVDDPATGDVIGHVPDLGAAETEQAIAAASETFKAWSRSDPHARAAFLRKWAALIDDNPLSKIPALRLADGSVIHDSRVILDYLDHQHVGNPLIPREGSARWRRLTLAALADGILEAAVLVRYELTLRPPEHHWAPWLEGQRDKIRRALAVLEAQALAELASHFDVAAISVACALAYLDFRHPDLEWRQQQPGLAAWYFEVSQRPSMLETRPPA